MGCGSVKPRTDAATEQLILSLRREGNTFREIALHAGLAYPEALPARPSGRWACARDPLSGQSKSQCSDPASMQEPSGSIAQFCIASSNSLNSSAPSSKESSSKSSKSRSSSGWKSYCISANSLAQGHRPMATAGNYKPCVCGFSRSAHAGSASTFSSRIPSTCASPGASSHTTSYPNAHGTP